MYSNNGTDCLIKLPWVVCLGERIPELGVYYICVCNRIHQHHLKEGYRGSTQRYLRPRSREKLRNACMAHQCPLSCWWACPFTRQVGRKWPCWAQETQSPSAWVLPMSKGIRGMELGMELEAWSRKLSSVCYTCSSTEQQRNKSVIDWGQ